MSCDFTFMAVLFLLLVLVTASCRSQNYDIKALSLTVTQSIDVGYSPVGIVYNPDGDSVYVANSGSDTVSVINGVTNNVTATILVGSKPTALAYDSYHHLLYVTNCDSNNVYVINVDTNKVVPNLAISVGRCPYSIAYNPNNHDLYVANFKSNNTSVISSSSNKVVANITVGNNPTGIAYNPENDGMYVTNRASNVVSVIDSANNKVVANITVGIYPTAIAVAYNGLYVANLGSHDTTYTSVIDSIKNTQKGKLYLNAAQPSGIAFNQYTKMAYVTSSASNSLYEINATTTQYYIKKIKLENPEQVAINLKTNNIYVSSPKHNKIFVIGSNATVHVPENIRWQAIVVGTLSIIVIPIVLIFWFYIRWHKKHRIQNVNG
jgi:YVTN family beta-propeller protein